MRVVATGQPSWFGLCLNPATRSAPLASISTGICYEKKGTRNKNFIMNSPHALLFCLLASVALVASFRSSQEDSLTDAYLRDLIRQWDAGNGDSYMADNDVDSNFDDFAIRPDDSDEGYEENKALDLLQQRLQRPSLSLRDQEYLQHSSLFSKTPSEKDEDVNSLKNLGVQSANKIAAAFSGKTPGTVLPAYCNPPNPCPVGYTAEDGCLEDFDNTAAFSRAYQGAQDCMCDMEHMFDCPEPRGKNDNGSKQAGASANMVNTAIRKIMSEMQQGLHKSLVSKKFQTNQLYDVDMEHLKEQAIDTVMSASNPAASENPYLQGEKLPIAAKKGSMIFADK